MSNTWQLQGGLEDHRFLELLETDRQNIIVFLANVRVLGRGGFDKRGEHKHCDC